MVLLAVLFGACAVAAAGGVGGDFLAPRVAAAGLSGAAPLNLTESPCGSGGAVDFSGACALKYYRWHDCTASHGASYDSWTCSCYGGPPGFPIPQDFQGGAIDLPGWASEMGGCCLGHGETYDSWFLTDCSLAAGGGVGGDFLAPQAAAAGLSGAASFNLTESPCGSGGAVDVTRACALQYYRWRDCTASHGASYDSWTCSCSGGPPGGEIPEDFQGRGVDLQGWASEVGGCCLGHGETYDSWFLTDCSLAAAGGVGGDFLAPRAAAAGLNGAAPLNLTESPCGSGGEVDFTGACALKYYRWHDCTASHGASYDSWTCSCYGGPPGFPIPQDFQGGAIDLPGWASEVGGCCLGHGESYDSWFLTDCP